MTERQSVTTRRHATGARALAARRPLSVFFAIVFVLGWPILTVPLLTDRGLIGGGAVPAGLFALGVTWFLMLPAALWVTAAAEGPAAARGLLRRLLRWRLGVWWGIILLALPTATLGVGLVLGGSLDPSRDLSSLLRGLVLLFSAVLVIHLCEETVWAGFVQTRLERRHNLVVASLLTAVPFAAIHVPLILIGETAVLSAVGGVLVLGVAMRLLIGVFLRGTGGSLLASGLVHGVYNACNNDNALLDELLRGADQNLAAPIALVVVTTTAAAVIHRRDRVRESPRDLEPEPFRAGSTPERAGGHEVCPSPTPAPEARATSVHRHAGRSSGAVLGGASDADGRAGAGADAARGGREGVAGPRAVDAAAPARLAAALLILARRGHRRETVTTCREVLE